MTFQPPASAPATATLPDLQQQHERARKQFRTARLVALIGLGVLAFVLACIPLAMSPGLKGLVGGLVAFVLVVLLFGGLVLFSQRKEGRHPGPASHGPSSYGQVLTSAPGPQVWEAVNAALRELKFVPGRPVDPQTVVSSRSVSMSSWGETVMIRVVATQDGRGLVTAWSRPAYPLQWLDYGRNRKFANTILNAIPDATAVG